MAGFAVAASRRCRLHVNALGAEGDSGGVSQPRHDAFPKDGQPAVPAPIVELARDRGQKSVVETPPETTAPSPVATHAAGASVSRQAAIPPSDEPEEDAMPWAGVISHATGDQTGTHATG